MSKELEKRLSKRKTKRDKKTFKDFVRDMSKLPKVFREGQEREKKELEAFKKRKKK